MENTNKESSYKQMLQLLTSCKNRKQVKSFAILFIKPNSVTDIESYKKQLEVIEKDLEKMWMLYRKDKELFNLIIDTL